MIEMKERNLRHFTFSTINDFVTTFSKIKLLETVLLYSVEDEDDDGGSPNSDEINPA